MMRCRRCQADITAADRQCPFCKTLLKALIPLGDFNGMAIQLYLSYADDGPQIAALRAILEKFQAQAEAIKALRELHKPRWDNCINACCSGEQCRNRYLGCAAGCDEWPCDTARLVYTADEQQTKTAGAA